VISRVLSLVAGLVAGVLILFTARRWLFTLAALVPRFEQPSGLPGAASTPDVLILVPLRNESQALPALFSALGSLDYPGDKVVTVFVDDGSTDESGSIVNRRIERETNWYLLSLDQNIGKANALNYALDHFAWGEVVVIYDADERPQPGALRQLVRHFGDAGVGGVSGRRAVSNGLHGPVASYIAFEGLVHQLVTMQAKDRLDLAPALLGANCAYRRQALAGVGNFRPGALLEDTDQTLQLVRAGWRIRFEPYAVSYHCVPETVPGYWQQHTRWARGFNDVARERASAVLREGRLPMILRLELLVFSLGYLDRLALLAALGLAWAGQRFVARILALSLLTPLLQVMAALKIGREPEAMWWRVIWLPIFFGLDIAMAAVGFFKTIRRAPRIWEERQARQ
jgi:cellulose synthase/poly-beta-1,6-N-acetylglucosamine synthase-like glycosyltransferase